MTNSNPENIYLMNDFRDIYDSFNKWSSLDSKSILITGGTGLIGSFYAKAFLYINSKYRLNMKITITFRDHSKLNMKFSNYLNRVDFKAMYWNAHEKFDSTENYDIVLHTVNITSSKLYVDKPIETIMTTIDGTNNLLNFFKEKKLDSFIYLSSMEIYGEIQNDNIFTSENFYGTIDLLNPRSSYPLSKRVSENLCIGYNKQYNLPVKIMRLAQTFGAGIDWSENRIFAQFSKSIINNSDIILHTDGTSRGNYVSIVDTFIASLYIILYGENGEAYNVVNEENFSTIIDMAKKVVNLYPDKKISVKFDIPESSMVYGYAPKTYLRLSSKKLEHLGWKPIKNLSQMYIDTINFLIEERKNTNENKKL